MSKYLCLTRMFIITFFSNRSRYLIGTVSNCIILIINYYFWTYISNANSNTTSNNLLLYVMIANLIRPIIIYFRLPIDIGAQVKSGQIISILIKPISLFEYWFSMQIGRIVVFFVLMCLPLCAVILTLDFSLLTSGILNIYFGISLLLAIYISTVFCICLGMLSYWLEDCQGINSLNNILFYFASGAIIPIGLYPDWVKDILSFLPYKSLIDIPLNIGISKDVSLIYEQVVWAVILALIYNYMNKKALKHIDAVG